MLPGQVISPYSLLSFLILSTILLVLSLFIRVVACRKRPQSKLDHLSSAAFVLATMLGAAQLGFKLWASYRYVQAEAQGRPELSTPNIAWFKGMFFWTIGYLAELWLLKLAFLAFYGQIYRRADLWFQKALYAVIAFVICSFIPPFVDFLMVCRPISDSWNPQNLCRPTISKELNIVFSALHISSDLMILLLPLTVLHYLGVRTRAQRIAVAFVLMIGALSVFTSIVKLVVFLELRIVGDPRKYTPSPRTRHVADVLDYIEKDAAYVAFTLPSLRVCLKDSKLLSSLGSKLRKSSGAPLEKIGLRGPGARSYGPSDSNLLRAKGHFDPEVHPVAPSPSPTQSRNSDVTEGL